MSNCTDCFNGCVNITSDKCVKYTGPTIPELGITHGDPASAIIAYLSSAIIRNANASSITVEIEEQNLCDLISNNLPPGATDLSLNDYIVAMIKSSCSLKEQIDTLEATVNVAEEGYDVKCLLDVTPYSGTHDILESTIKYLCTLKEDYDNFVLDVTTNYVLKQDVNTYIDAYIASTGTITSMKSKMVPNTVVEYYGSLSFFDATGAGTGEWDKIYLCNGQNGTPDKRGRVGVGTTTGMGGDVYTPDIDPAIAGNPTYSLLTPYGSNTITLSQDQMPNHTHTATFTGDPHNHAFPYPLYSAGGPTDNEVLSAGTTINNYVVTQTEAATATGTVSVASTGTGNAHENIQPVLPCYYIMYIP